MEKHMKHMTDYRKKQDEESKLKDENKLLKDQIEVLNLKMQDNLKMTELTYNLEKDEDDYIYHYILDGFMNIFSNIKDYTINLFGSTALYYSSPNFIMKYKNHEARDLDIMIISNDNLNIQTFFVNKFTEIFGSYFSYLSVNTSYSFFKFTEILSVTRCTFEFTSKNIFMIPFDKIHNLIDKNKKIYFHIDLVISKEENMKLVPDVSRSFYFCVNDGNQFITYKQFPEQKKFTSVLKPTLFAFYYGWIPCAIHLYGGNTPGRTPSGDLLKLDVSNIKHIVNNPNKSVDYVRLGYTNTYYGNLKVPKPKCFTNANVRTIDDIKKVLKLFNFSDDEQNVNKIKSSFDISSTECCPYCLEEFNEVPYRYKVLTPCMHIACLKCLMGILKKYICFKINRINKLSGLNDDGDASFTNCPTCRKQIFSTDDGKIFQSHEMETIFTSSIEIFDMHIPNEYAKHYFNKV